MTPSRRDWSRLWGRYCASSVIGWRRSPPACRWTRADGLYDKPDEAALDALPEKPRKPRTALADNRRARAYRAQSAFLLRHSDLLIAAADPDDRGKAGGTLETVREALAFELPVIFIHTGKTGDNVYLIGPEDDLYSVLAAPPPAVGPCSTNARLAHSDVARFHRDQVWRGHFHCPKYASGQPREME